MTVTRTSMCGTKHATCVGVAFGTAAGTRRAPGKTPRHVQSPRTPWSSTASGVSPGFRWLRARSLRARTANHC